MERIPAAIQTLPAAVMSAVASEKEIPVFGVTNVLWTQSISKRL